MKRSATLLLLACTFLTAQAQTVDTLFWNSQREPTLYYWDTNWVDYKYQHGMTPVTHQNGAECYGTQFARPCLTIYDNGLDVIGIAAAASIWHAGAIIDTAVAHRVPEYFELYKPVGDSMILLDSTRWDTSTVRYRMELISQLHITYHYYPDLREAYFTKPIHVTDSFYISGTTFNNRCECDDLTGSAGRFEHPVTSYWGVSDLYQRSRYFHNPPIFRYRYTNICPSAAPFHDYEWHFVDYTPHPGNGFLCIFPIFDTTGMNTHGGGHTDDSSECRTPTGFRILDQDHEAISLTWNTDGYSAWEISFCPAGTDPNYGAIQQTGAPFATIAAAEVDTGVWYAAYVRTVCDNVHSIWSDSVQFIMHRNQTPNSIGDFDDEYTLIAPNPTSSKVSLFSSYYIRSYELYNLKGQLMEQRSVHATGTTIDVASYPRGTYILRLHTAYGESTHKVVLR